MCEFVPSGTMPVIRTRSPPTLETMLVIGATVVPIDELAVARGRAVVAAAGGEERERGDDRTKAAWRVPRRMQPRSYSYRDGLAKAILRFQRRLRE